MLNRWWRTRRSQGGAPRPRQTGPRRPWIRSPPARTDLPPAWCRPARPRSSARRPWSDSTARSVRTPPRRERLFAAASAKGVPLRTILTIDAVVIATWVLYRLIGRLREVILWTLMAAFIALVLDPSVAFLQRHRMRRGTAVGLVFACAVLGFGGLLALFGYPLVNSVTHVAELTRGY